MSDCDDYDLVRLELAVDDRHELDAEAGAPLLVPPCSIGELFFRLGRNS